MTVGSGCTTSGPCFQSLNYPNDYGSSQSCTIKVQNAGVLSSVGFNTESGYDKLTIGGTVYQGTSGPSNVAVSVNTAITWSSDGSTQSSGFIVCLVLPQCSEGVNSERCACGTSDCTASTGLFCLGGQCHDYKPNAAYYYDGNMALMDDMGASALKTAYNNIENC